MPLRENVISFCCCFLKVILITIKSYNMDNYYVLQHQFFQAAIHAIDVGFFQSFIHVLIVKPHSLQTKLISNSSVP